MKPTTEAIAVLRPATRNPREISDEAAAGLGISMQEFGDLSGITWNEETGNLVCGHARTAELSLAGAKVWTRVDETSGYVMHPKTGEKFPIRIVRWPEAR